MNMESTVKKKHREGGKEKRGWSKEIEVEPPAGKGNISGRDGKYGEYASRIRGDRMSDYPDTTIVACILFDKRLEC
jgi:hypothetical protein